MEKLMYPAEENNISVKFALFEASDGRPRYIRNELRIGIRIGMTFDDYIYNLAQYFLHYDKGNMIRVERHTEYEEQANRTAGTLLEALRVI